MTDHRFLGGFISNQGDEYVMSKVQRWVRHLDLLSEVALTQLQLAYADLSRSLQHEWTFLLYVVLLYVILQCGQVFQELEMSLFSHFCQLCLVLKCQQLNDVCLRFLCD